MQFKCQTVLFQTIQFSISTQFCSIWPIDRTLLSSTTLGRVDLGSMAKKGYSAFPKAPALLDILTFKLFNVISRILVRGSCPTTVVQLEYSTIPSRVGQKLTLKNQLLTLWEECKYKVRLKNLITWHKILSFNLTGWDLSFNLVTPCGPQTPFIGVRSALISLVKSHQRQHKKSSYELFEPILIYIFHHRRETDFFLSRVFHKNIWRVSLVREITEFSISFWFHLLSYFFFLF